MTDATASTAAGWYPDPAGSGRSRWWNGGAWTEDYQQPYSYNAIPTALVAPEGTKPYTVWIWITVALLISSAVLMNLDLRYNIASRASGDSLAGLSSPGYILLSLSQWLAYGLSALFAFLDWRQLKAVGVPRPFHFAWVFLSSTAYVIGRSVIVRRRVGGGIIPMWIAIGTLVASVLLAIFAMVVTFVSMATEQSPAGY